jgi:hypothetical protein
MHGLSAAAGRSHSDVAVATCRAALTMETKAIRSFGTWTASRPTARRHVPKEFNTQLCKMTGNDNQRNQH